MLELDARVIVNSQPSGRDIVDIYRAHSAAVTRWAQRLGGPELDVEDLVQEVFLLAHQSLHQFRGESAVSTWLFRITERAVAQRRRKDNKRRNMEKIFSFLAPSADAPAPEFRSNEPTPLEALQDQRDKALFYKALDTLTEKHRSPFVLYALEGYSGEEIAALKGVPVATVWVWLHRARKQFMTRIAELEQRGDK